MAEGVFWQLTKGIPAACRSSRLRRSGTRPDETAALYRVPAEHAQTDTARSYEWDFTPGNSPGNAVDVYRGEWDGARQDSERGDIFLARSYNPRTTLYETHLVEWNGILWRCVVDCTTEEPKAGCRGWVAESLREGVLYDSTGDFLYDRNNSELYNID